MNNEAGRIIEDPVPAEVANTPINAPPVLVVSDGSGTGPVDDGSQVIDLVNCEGVEFEMREGKPGVKFRQGGEEEWTPVVRKRNRKKRKALVNHSDESCESSDEDLKITRHSRSVKYRAVNGEPGLRIQRGSTMSSVRWTPIIVPTCTPIASRTRAKTINL